MKKNEIEIIEEIRKRFSFPKSLGIGIGDDSAFLKFKKPALLTTDLMIENVHFDFNYFSFYHLGFKIVSVNVSDIYAMGGKFLAFLLSLGIPQSISEEQLNDLFDGIREALKYYKGHLIGGDISKSEKVILSGFAIGECDKPLLRIGAEVGDNIFITAPIGLSSAGLSLLRGFTEGEKRQIKETRDLSKLRQLDEKFGFSVRRLIQRHLMPTARNPHKFKKIAKAMMDISDGLLIDLYRLCEENDVGAEIYLERIPILTAVLKAAEYTNSDPWRFILSGGEDYELLVISKYERAEDLGLIQIGRIIEKKGIYLNDPEKGIIPVKPEGWQHF